jgi:hypothetical protein
MWTTEGETDVTTAASIALRGQDQPPQNMRWLCPRAGSDPATLSLATRVHRGTRYPDR